MQSTITVLTPNGRRQNVKVDANKTVLWILEQVCAKHGFNPETHGLKQHNKLLDLSQIFRFSGIPNNSNLEMVETEAKRVEQPLLVCLQLEDGSRFNGNFSSAANLQDVINELCKHDYQHPVIVYMRTEVFGEDLKTKTLKSLGLASGGRALLRLINKDPETLRVQANVSAPLPQKPKEEATSDEMTAPSKKSVPAPSQLLSDIKKLKAEQKSETEEVETKPADSEPMDIEAYENTDETAAAAQPANQSPEVSTETLMSDIPAAVQEEPVINYLDDRGTIIFSLDSLKISDDDVPDSFFELTESEIRKLYSELKIQVEELDNKPLMTKELRALEENKRILNQLSVYKATALRIQFPNRYVIQSKFSVVETIEVVTEFVRKFLVNPDLEFYLFTTPPKFVLEKSSTLIESNLVPSALLHFGCNTVLDDYLKPEFYAKLSSGSGVNRTLGTQSAASNRKANSPNVPSTSSDAKGAVPKWFKVGK